MQEGAPLPASESLIEDWQSWLLGERSLSKQTAEMYRWRLSYLLRLAGDKHPLDITTADMRAHMLQTCPKASTKGAALRALRSFFGFLHAEGWRSDDPSRAIRQPKIPETLPKYLDHTEAAKLDAAAYWEGVQLHALCRMYLYEGLRAAEGCRLAWLLELGETMRAKLGDHRVIGPQKA